MIYIIIINAKILPFKFKITTYDFYHTENHSEKELVAYFGNEQLGEE